MNPSRETIAVALFALFTPIGPSGTKAFGMLSRRPALWDEAMAMPALFLGQPMDNYQYDNGTAAPPKITLAFDLFIYTNTALDPNIIPDTMMNNCIDAVESALAPPPTMNFKQTLGGLVDHAWIEGQIARAPGYLDGQGMALGKINVLVPW